MDANYADQIGAMNSAQKDAFYQYTLNKYVAINTQLRGDSSAMPGTTLYINALDGFFAQPQAQLRHDIQVVRAIGYERVQGYNVGDTFTDDGFISTSVNPIMGGSDDDLLSTRLDIQVPKGTRAAWVRPLSEHQDESEVLLDRGTTFEVVAKNGRTMTVKVVGQR